MLERLKHTQRSKPSDRTDQVPGSAEREAPRPEEEEPGETAAGGGRRWSEAGSAAGLGPVWRREQQSGGWERCARGWGRHHGVDGA